MPGEMDRKSGVLAPSRLLDQNLSLKAALATLTLVLLQE
jgi:hypothetical protein